MANNPYVNKVVYGGTTLMDITDTTAVASDVASGKYFYTADGARVQGTASGGGGGGASNFVTGTFTGTTTGAAMDVTLNYNGTGYPVAAIVYPKSGIKNTDGTFNSLVQRNAIALWSGEKDFPSLTPDYSANTNINWWSVASMYKSSSSNANNYGGSVSTALRVMENANSTSSSYYCVKFRSKTKMSVYIASTSNGFAANIEYTYHVIYSS